MNSLIQTVTHRLDEIKSDKSSIKQYFTVKNVLLLLILLDICRIIAVFSQVSSPHNLGQMELNMSIFVGLDVVAFYGVCVEQKSLLFVYLSFYTGLIASSLFGSPRRVHHYSICCLIGNSGLQLALSFVLIWYILTSLPSKKEANSSTQEFRPYESTKPEEAISPKAFIYPGEGIKPEEGVKPIEGINPEECI